MAEIQGVKLKQEPANNERAIEAEIENNKSKPKTPKKKPKPLIDENYRKESESFGPEGF